MPAVPTCALTNAPLEFLPQSLPALEILMIKLRTLQGKLRRLAHKASFKHERHRVSEINRLQFRLARPLKRLRVRPMTRHAIVQTRATRHESFRLGVIFAADQSHELVHEIAM